MRLNQSSRSLVFWSVGTFLWAASVVLAQDQSNTMQHLSVIGHGKVKALPTSVVLAGTIVGEAELSGDALAKFLTSREEAVAAVKKLELENFEIETGGFAVGPTATTDSVSAALLRSRGAAPEPPKVTVQEGLRIRLNKINEMDRNKLAEIMVKIIDAGKESGVNFGPPTNSRSLGISREDYTGFATFIIDDNSEHREKAENLAMEDARVKASRLAKLCGCRLGEVRTIQEIQTFNSSLRTMPPDTSAKFDEIEITVSLQVQFQIVPERYGAK